MARLRYHYKMNPEEMSFERFGQLEAELTWVRETEWANGPN